MLRSLCRSASRRAGTVEGSASNALKNDCKLVTCNFLFGFPNRGKSFGILHNAQMQVIGKEMNSQSVTGFTLHVCSARRKVTVQQDKPVDEGAGPQQTVETPCWEMQA